jgi:hypothetical protein
LPELPKIAKHPQFRPVDAMSPFDKQFLAIFGNFGDFASFISG